MTDDEAAVLKKLVKQMRKAFRPRDEHHSNCSSRTGLECDCYAQHDHKYHAILDQIEALL